LFLALLAAVALANSAASAGGCGWCGGCGQAFYATGLVACDAHPFYVVNHGPVYSGPAIVTYPTYTPRAYPYVHGCGFRPCYGFSYTRPVVYDDHYRYHRRYDYVRPTPRVVYIDRYRGPHRPMYRMKRHHRLPLK
jgi:hypothetical protein